MTRAAGALIVLAALGDPLHAAVPAQLPQLRIETGRHTAFIHALALDERRDRVYSASEDKTVRAWRVSDGRPLDVYRVPAGPKAEGQLYTVAVSPDGQTLATAGWTCWDNEGSACIYLFDVDSGELRARIAGLPEVVSTLRFSPDGRYLAAGLMGAKGLRVFEWRDNTLVGTDADYRDKLLELSFCPDGRLVASGLDGFVRLYDPTFRLVGRGDAGFAGHQPFGIRCSPDGRWIALGFNDVPRVNVLRSGDLAVAFTLTAPEPTLSSLTRVAWSADSAHVYATGESRAVEPSRIHRWSLAAPHKPESLPAAQGRIGAIELTRRNEVLFGAEDPLLGLLDPGGRARYLLGSGVPDFARTAASFRISGDGRQVEIALNADPHSLRRFCVDRTSLVVANGAAKDVFAPTLRAPGWNLTRWADPSGPRLNGHPLTLDPYETPHAWALLADAGLAFVGSEWTLRAFTRDATPRWVIRTPAVVRAVNATRDGRFVIAALSDGTLDWYRVGDGVRVLSLYLHADGTTWIAWTRDGSYASSAYGDNFVGWQVNRGPADAPDFFRAVQFERTLYRPDVIAHSLDIESTPEATESPDRFLAIAPPRLTLRAVDAAPNASASRRRIRIEGESPGLPMTDVTVFVNDIPITPARERRLTATEAHRFRRELEIDLDFADNDVRVEVNNGASLGVAERSLPATGVRATHASGDLRILAIGANRFEHLDPALTLSFAASDAQEFAQALQAASTQRYRRISVTTLSDFGRPADKRTILEALRQLQDAGAGDTTVIFLASHGVSDSSGDYFFVPHDARQADIDTILDRKPLSADASLVGWQSFFDVLRGMAGRRLLVVDTCQARDISGRFQDFSLVKRSASSRVAFILASRGSEESQEYTTGRHGLFTYALLDGLRAAPDLNADGQLSVGEWFHYAAAVVDRLRDRRIGPQTPQFYAPRSLQAMIVGNAARAGMPQ